MLAASGGRETGQRADVIQAARLRKNAAGRGSAQHAAVERSIHACHRKSGNVIRSPGLLLVEAQKLHGRAWSHQIIARQARTIGEHDVAVGDADRFQKILFNPQTGVGDAKTFLLVGHRAQKQFGVQVLADFVGQPHRFDQRQRKMFRQNSRVRIRRSGHRPQHHRRIGINFRRGRVMHPNCSADADAARFENLFQRQPGGLRRIGHGQFKFDRSMGDRNRPV